MFHYQARTKPGKPSHPKRQAFPAPQNPKSLALKAVKPPPGAIKHVARRVVDDAVRQAVAVEAQLKVGQPAHVEQWSRYTCWYSVWRLELMVCATGNQPSVARRYQAVGPGEAVAVRAHADMQRTLLRPILVAHAIGQETLDGLSAPTRQPAYKHSWRRCCSMC